jgi:hypothetical protein
LVARTGNSYGTENRITAFRNLNAVVYKGLEIKNGILKNYGTKYKLQHLEI